MGTYVRTAARVRATPQGRFQPAASCSQARGCMLGRARQSVEEAKASRALHTRSFWSPSLRPPLRGVAPSVLRGIPSPGWRRAMPRPRLSRRSTGRRSRRGHRPRRCPHTGNGRSRRSSAELEGRPRSRSASTQRRTRCGVAGRRRVVRWRSAPLRAAAGRHRCGCGASEDSGLSLAVAPNGGVALASARPARATGPHRR